MRGGVVVRIGRGLSARFVFVPGESAARLVDIEARATAPGLESPAVGIALANGEVVTVLSLASAGELGPAASVPEAAAEPAPPGGERAVLCDIDGERVVLAGGAAMEAGTFETSDGDEGVVWRGRHVPALDVRALYAAAAAALWSDRVASSRRLGGPS